MKAFTAIELIETKRDGGVLSKDGIDWLISAYTDGSVPDYQMSAMAMAVLINGLDESELAAWTSAMLDSGEILDFSTIAAAKVDKHSTGGVGDKVSICLAPLVASCGVPVPMISGRGLGHTGGTLDKLDSIPGYDTAPDMAAFRRTVELAGCAIIGQTAELAPADRRLYAIRDVTATVESIPLITASILSKKAAAGLAGLIMDVKTGSGAFARDEAVAVELAESIVAVAEDAGLPCVALITSMNQVLGRSAGNALEVGEAIAYLTGAARDPRLHEVVMALGAELLVLGGLDPEPAAARGRLEAVLDSGAAAERFARMVAALGGPADLLERHRDHLPAAPVVREIAPAEPGMVREIDTRALGVAVIGLGGGRKRAADPIDHAVGFTCLAAIGAAVDADTPLARVHARTEAAADAAAEALRAAYTTGAEAGADVAVILDRVG